MRVISFLGAATFVLLAGSIVAADDKDKFDAGKMVGTWTYVSGEKNGTKVDPETLKGGTVKITKETITLESPQGKFVIKYTLDTKNNPVSLAMEMTESPFGAGAMAKGIIDVKGEELKLCYATEGDAPKKFETKEGSNSHLFVLKKSK
ncbi:MAG TPA: TIGR03067 domain-containing protein [Gemmataceae bacterium]|nr:TIGR03067 domain-containing protein [Gemmataceae bacterium]